MTVNERDNADQLITLGQQARMWLWQDYLPAPQAQGLLEQLCQQLTWEQPQVTVFGRQHPVPRLTAWAGDEGLQYRYSGHLHRATGWPTALLPLRQELVRSCGVSFNSVLANLYRNGDDSMGYHSDDEAELGPRPWIASYSLGASRDFVLRPKEAKARQCYALALPHNSLLLMSPEVQQHFQHALPKRRRTPGLRLNLTFRQILI